jgi:hypothetical protein
MMGCTSHIDLDERRRRQICRAAELRPALSRRRKCDDPDACLFLTCEVFTESPERKWKKMCGENTDDMIATAASTECDAGDDEDRLRKVPFCLLRQDLGSRTPF